MRRPASLATALVATALSTACVAGGGHDLDLHVAAALSNDQEARPAAARTQSPPQAPNARALSEPMTLRDALALLAGDKARVGEGVTRVDIDLGPGTYRLTAPLTITLGPGWRGTPIALHGARDARVVISGARPLQGLEPVRDPAVLARLPAAARANVRVADLTKNGVPSPVPFAAVGFALPVQAVPLELFYRDRPLTLARWPKQGFATIAATPDGPQGARFTLAGADVAAWRGDAGLRAMGYWARDWADETLSVTGVDPASGILTLERAPRFGMKAGQRVFVENALSALDAPGDYYVDLRAGRVYVWPPGPTDGGELEMSVADSLLRMDNAAAVRISDLTFDMSRGDAVTLQGGRDLAFERVAILNAGARALVSSATDSRFAGLTVERSGAGGVVINAGDRTRLTPGNVVVANSGFDDYARLERAYRPAISISGVGDRIEGNVIHNGPHAAIIFSGNDHRIVGNKIYDVVQETRDAGAIYTGRDWTARGTVIENNFLHDIGTPERAQATKGIYLDDQASGITIRRNVFARVNQAVFIGGGRDNVVEQNLFVHCTPAIYIDSRGLSWQRAMVVDPHSTLRAQLSARHVEAPPYSTRYPSLAHLMSDVPGAPKGTVIANNAVVDGEALEIDNGARPFVQVQQTFGPADVRFAQPMSNSARHSLATLKLAPDSPALSRGFTPPAAIAPTRSGQ
jgi:hypothetical protein